MFLRFALGLFFQFLSFLLYEPPPGPQAASFSEFDIPKTPEGTRYRDFAGTRWFNDPIVAYAGDFASAPIYKKGGKK